MLPTNHKKTAVGALLCSILTAVSGLANAQEEPIWECKSEIAAARKVLNDGTEIVAKNNKDQTLASLNSKLYDADYKLQQLKCDDAETKLLQFGYKVYSLGLQGRISETDSEFYQCSNVSTVLISMPVALADMHNDDCLLDLANIAFMCVANLSRDPADEVCQEKKQTSKLAKP